ncbi:tetrahydrofolate dehydrogenase/cyclohydrolase catalytic domain-containing protein [Vibrio harveyi]|uniref:tetrahydrofolate dehydrogenase/cyclohydrolase catalytic domain-containing protein n=1 Tax=Vibrio harveyi TaxID=669 RepID=UPI003CEC7BC5
MKEIINTIHNVKLDTIQTEITGLGLKPKLTLVSVGNDPASQVYMRNKKRLLGDAGVQVNHIELDEHTATQSDLDAIAESLDHPALFQLPLPKGLYAPDLPVHFDADAFGSEALGQLTLGNSSILPCTVQAVFDIIEHQAETTGNYLAGAKVAVIGRSLIVGKPLTIELINRQATVTSFNSKSNLKDVDWSQFNIVIVAAGSHGVVKSSQFNKGQLIIDVGINRHEGRLVGDVEHDVASEADITPVPGGVGRLTVLNLLDNTYKLSRN